MITVWAPRATRVRLRRPAQDDIEMTPQGAEGWWTAEVDPAAGEEYGFVLGESETPRPDPRSRRQPHGVHGLSAWDDPGAHEWTDGGWTGRQLAGGVVYEMHIGTFTPAGTLDAAIERIPHLVDLGVTHVELLPVNAFNGVWNWGYDGVLWFAVHEEYGGPGAYRRFVDAAHAADLAVIQDVVYNHLGPSGNYLPEFGPYLRSGEGNPWGDSIDLDEPEVRRYIIDNALMWMRDFHVDGLRLDAVHALHDDGPVHILQEMAEATDALSAQLGRPLTLIAESDMNDPRLILPREAGGYGLTAQWSDDWHHAVHVAATGETVGYYADFADADALPKTWARGFFHDGTYSSFRGRTHGHPLPAPVPTWRLVTFAQDHDQIGNRAAGDRLSHSLSFDRLAVVAVLTMTAPGTPMLFMGEEWGASTPWAFFTSHPEPELAEATARGRIGEFARMGWDRDQIADPQDPRTFIGSKLDWDEAGVGEHARLQELYRRLARLRRERPELTDPGQDRLTASSGPADADAPQRRWYRLGRGALEVLVNLTAQPTGFAVDPGQVVLLGTDAAIVASGGELVLPPDTAAVVGPPG